MSEYTLDVNGKRYELNDSVRASLEERAERAYGENWFFSCWWQVAKPENYRGDEWEQNIHEEGDPILVIETEGPMVPWDGLDQLEARMPERMDRNETEDVDSGNGIKSMKPDDAQRSNEDIFGRTHFGLTPHRYEEVPEPGGDDPNKLPPKPEKVDGEMLVAWVPRHPNVEHSWATGEAITSATSTVEWNVQKRADQPSPSSDNGHDSFESMCLIHDCDVIGEYAPSNDIPEGKSGSVERKGEESFENGKYGGDNFHV